MSTATTARPVILSSDSAAAAKYSQDWCTGRVPLITPERRAAMRQYAAGVYRDLDAQGIALDGSGRVLDFVKYAAWLKAQPAPNP